MFLLLSFLLTKDAFATIWYVGPTRTYTTPGEVSNLVNDGDTIYIDAALYTNHPQVHFTADHLFFQGIGGRPRLEAGSALANNSNGKAIFVIGGSDCIVDNIEFADAAVPDNNGAGIRQEGCDLTVTNCYFTGNEMGVLGGAFTDCTVRLEHNIFSNNGSTQNPGYQHNIYIGNIDSLIFRYNYSIDAIAEGHELKSRANTNIIMYNFIGNLTTEDSRTIDLPNGGTAVLVGNIIEQGPESANSNIFGYGQEGLSNPSPHNVWMTNNTIINKKQTGNFIQLAGGTQLLFLKNNIMVGAMTSGLIQGSAAQLDSAHNLVNTDINAAGFYNANLYDYHLDPNSQAINAGIVVNQTVGGYALNPAYQYVDPAAYEDRPVNGSLDIGAFEYNSTTSNSGVSILQKLILYPNPIGGDQLYIKNLSVDSPYIICSADGRYIQGGVIINGWIDISRLSRGAYGIRIGQFAMRFVKS